MTKLLDSMSLAELGDELNGIITSVRDEMKEIEKSGRTLDTLSAEDQTKLNPMLDRIPLLKKAIADKSSTKNRLITDLTEAEAFMKGRNESRTPNQLPTQTQAVSKMTWNRRNISNIGREYQFSPSYGSPAYNQAFSNWLRGMDHSQAFHAVMAGSPGMSVSEDARGGYFVVGEAFSTELLKNVDDAVFVQSLSRVIMMPPGAQSYGIRVRKQKASTFDWGAENRNMAGMYDTSLKYGKRTLTPNWLQGSCIISKELIRNYPQAESMVIGELALDAAEVLETAYLYGNGNMKPLGLMTPDADGIDTDRDYETTRNAGFTFDDFVNMKFELKPRYRNSARWMFHRYVFRDICLLKDGEGRYLWQPSRQVGEPDLILGLPFTESEWMPDEKVAGGYFALLGDFSYYYIIWDMMMQMQRLQETRAYTNEFEYLFRCKVDAGPVLPEAFVRGVYGDTDVE